MKVNINNVKGIQLIISFEFDNMPDVRSTQLFYGSATPIHTYWDKKLDISELINYAHENNSFPGTYLLWQLAHLSFLQPEMEDGFEGKRFKRNVRPDCHEIYIYLQETECKDHDKIISEISNLFEKFDLDATVNDMIENFNQYLSGDFGIQKWRRNVGIENLQRFEKHFKQQREYLTKLLA